MVSYFIYDTRGEVDAHFVTRGMASMWSNFAARSGLAARFFAPFAAQCAQRLGDARALDACE
jgi:hypothetical protein